MLRILSIALALSVASVAHAQERSVTITSGQVSVPAGLTVQVKSVTISPDATKVRILASFDNPSINFVNMNDSKNAYLAWGEGEQERLHMRQIPDNRWMRIMNGTTMEGDIIFPGTLPATAQKVSLVFNPGNRGDDRNGPGVIIPLDLKQ